MIGLILVSPNIQIQNSPKLDGHAIRVFRF